MFLMYNCKYKRNMQLRHLTNIKIGDDVTLRMFTNIYNEALTYTFTYTFALELGRIHY